jgi:hypothetical protein
MVAVDKRRKKEEGAATDFVTDVTDVTDRRNQESGRVDS